MASSQKTDDGLECVCCRWTSGLQLPEVVHSLEELQVQSRAKSTNLFHDWVLLNKTLKRCEDTIRKRWLKKNHAQRDAILITAWPGMAASHRPDFAQLRDIGHKACKRRINHVKEREAFLYPYINREDLGKHANLLTFLNSRGRYLPHEFALEDLHFSHTADIGPSECAEINQYRMILHESCTPKSYGRLTTFVIGDNIDMLGMHPIGGFRVLEIQEQLLRFLVACTRLILHDMDLSKIDMCPTKEVTIAIPQAVESWQTVTALRNEAPYRPPQSLDLDRISMLVDAKRSEAEEHLFSLREDPGYFAMQVQEWAEHSTEMILDKHKKRHSRVGETAFWDELCKRVIKHAYRSLIFLNELVNELSELVMLKERHEDNISENRPLPPMLEMAFQRVDKIVDELQYGPLNDLVVGVPASPAMRNGFIRNTNDQTCTWHELQIKPGKQDTSWRVQFLFRTLLTPDQHEKHGLANILGEIQRTLDEHSEASDTISSWVIARLEDLALAVEIRHQLDLFQPWSTIWRYRADPKFLDSAFEAFGEFHELILETINEAKEFNFDPSCFAYPSDKRRSKSTVTRMRTSEKSLDDLWEIVDDHFMSETGMPLNFFSQVLVVEKNRQMRRTPAWVEPEEACACPPTTKPDTECLPR